MPVQKPNLDLMTITRSSSIFDSMKAIDQGGVGLTVVASEDGRFDGVITDGDLRRALLSGASIQEEIGPYIPRFAVTLQSSGTRAQALDLMRAHRIDVVPIVDDEGIFRGLHTMHDIFGRKQLPNYAIVMAGGRGTRLGALTKDRPKPLMPIAGRPVIEWIILGLVESGITNIVVSVAYLAEQIMDQLGDGRNLGCRITYLREDPEQPRSTAGALAEFCAAHPDNTDAIILTNGDVMTRYNAADLLEHHDRVAADVTIAAATYRHRVPFGVLETDAGNVSGIVEKPEITNLVSSGIYAISPTAYKNVPEGIPFSMPDLVEQVLEREGQVSFWNLESDWIDIGTPSDLRKAMGA